MLTREELQVVYEQGPEATWTVVEQLLRRLQEQQVQLLELRARVKELEAQMALNSRNSSKPPSSDSVTRPPRSLRQPSGRKSGGQPGHPGKTLSLVAVPDETAVHEPTHCEACGTGLGEVAGELDPERRQVFDLPPLKLAVTEHRVRRKACAACGQENRGRFPAAVPCGASYGAGIQGLLTYLNQGHLLPSARSCQIVSDLFGQPIAEGTLQAAITQCAAGLEETETRIKQGLTQAEVAHFDETGLSVGGKRHWLHSASTAQLTHYACHERRGSAATQEIGILPTFTGRAVHDGLSAYWAYACLHALCNAHHLRELIFAHEHLQRRWAGEMKTLLGEIKHAVDTATAQQELVLSPRQLAAYTQRYAAIVQEGLAEEAQQPPLPTGLRGRKKQSKSKNLLDRLIKYQEETLVFMHDFAVPFDNNQAEVRFVGQKPDRFTVWGIGPRLPPDRGWERENLLSMSV